MKQGLITEDEFKMYGQSPETQLSSCQKAIVSAMLEANRNCSSEKRAMWWMIGTGMGKTRIAAALSHFLLHLKVHKVKRVIVILPDQGLLEKDQPLYNIN